MLRAMARWERRGTFHSGEPILQRGARRQRPAKGVLAAGWKAKRLTAVGREQLDSSCEHLEFPNQ